MRRALLALALAVAACASGPTAPPPKPLPAGARFEGEWLSNWGAMTLHRRGDRVWGTFATRKGTVWGEAKGNVFTFNWKQMETMRWGRGYLVLAGDGRSLEGRWGFATDDQDGGVWFADRKPEASGS